MTKQRYNRHQRDMMRVVRRYTELVIEEMPEGERAGSTDETVRKAITELLADVEGDVGEGEKG